jgi:hypothetical protein
MRSYPHTDRYERKTEIILGFGNGGYRTETDPRTMKVRDDLRSIAAPPV